jgi:DNA-binding FrmR family transcriptional regulator
MLSAEIRDELIKRLRRIEGQTQGIQRMLAAGRDCREVLNQLASVQAATRRVSEELVRCYALSRLKEAQTARSEGAVEEVIGLLLRIQG